LVVVTPDHAKLVIASQPSCLVTIDGLLVGWNVGTYPVSAGHHDVAVECFKPERAARTKTFVIDTTRGQTSRIDAWFDE